MKAPDANAPCQTIPIAHLVRNSVTTGSIEDLVDSTAPKQTTTTQLAQDGQKIIVRLIARSPTTKSRQTYLIRFSNDDQACQFTEQLYRKLPPSITKPKPRLPAEFQKIYEQAKRSTRERSVGSEQLNDIDFDAIIDAAVASRISNISVYEASKTANDELNEDQAQDRSSEENIVEAPPTIIYDPNEVNFVAAPQDDQRPRLAPPTSHKYRAMFSYTARSPSELDLNAGDIIEAVEAPEEDLAQIGYFRGRLNGRDGWFPALLCEDADTSKAMQQQ